MISTRHYMWLTVGASLFSCHTFGEWSDGMSVGLVAEAERQFENKHSALDPERTLVPVDPLSSRTVLKFDYEAYWQDTYVEVRSRPYYTVGQETDGESQQRTEHALIGQLMGDITLNAGVTNFITGSGYSWNPANPFSDIRHNEKDSASEFVREGDPFATIKYDADDYSVEFYWTDYLTVDQENKLAKGRLNSYALKVNKLFNETEWDVTTALLHDQPFIGTSLSSTFGDQLELHLEAAGVSNKQRFELNRTPIQFGPDNQTLNTLVPGDDEHALNLLLGGQFTFENNTNFILEYLYNGSGMNQTDWDTYIDAVNDSRQNINHPIISAAHQGFLLNSHNIVGLSRQRYLFLRAAFVEDGEDDTLSILSRINLDDSSFLSGINQVWNLSDAFVLTATANYFKGSRDSEYGWVPYELSVLASIETYFH